MEERLNPVGWVKSPKTKPHRSTAAQQAVEIQQTLYDATKQPKLAANVLAQVARAWCEIVDTRRVLAMKPAPKPIDVAQFNAAKVKRRQPSTGPTDTPDG